MNSLRDLFYVILCVTILSFSTTMANGQLKHNAKTPVDPATSPLPAEERGTVINGTIENSTIYPGTKRNYQELPCCRARRQSFQCHYRDRQPDKQRRYACNNRAVY